VAAALALRDAGEPLPVALVLLSPWLDLTLSGESIGGNVSRDAMLTSAWLAVAADEYRAGREATTPGLSPLYAELTGLSPMDVQAAGDELLVSDADRFVERARASRFPASRTCSCCTGRILISAPTRSSTCWKVRPLMSSTCCATSSTPVLPTWTAPGGGRCLRRRDAAPAHPLALGHRLHQLHQLVSDRHREVAGAAVASARGSADLHDPSRPCWAIPQLRGLRGHLRWFFGESSPPRVSEVGNEVAGCRRTGGPAHRGEPRSSSWRSTGELDTSDIWYS